MGPCNLIPHPSLVAMEMKAGTISSGGQNECHRGLWRRWVRLWDPPCREQTGTQGNLRDGRGHQGLISPSHHLLGIKRNGSLSCFLFSHLLADCQPGLLGRGGRCEADWEAGRSPPTIPNWVFNSILSGIYFVFRLSGEHCLGSTHQAALDWTKYTLHSVVGR